MSQLKDRMQRATLNNHSGINHVVGIDKILETLSQNFTFLLKISKNIADASSHVFQFNLKNYGRFSF